MWHAKNSEIGLPNRVASICMLILLAKSPAVCQRTTVFSCGLWEEQDAGLHMNLQVRGSHYSTSWISLGNAERGEEWSALWERRWDGRPGWHGSANDDGMTAHQRHAGVTLALGDKRLVVRRAA